MAINELRPLFFFLFFFLDKCQEIQREAKDAGEGRLLYEKQVKLLGAEYDTKYREYADLLSEGVGLYLEILHQRHPDMPSQLAEKIVDLIDGKTPKMDGMPLNIDHLRETIQTAEEESCRISRQALDRIRAEHKALTLAWARASDLQAEVLKEELDRLEVEINRLKDQTLPIYERLRHADEEMDALLDQLKALSAEYPTREMRQKGEAMRQIFNRVDLFWDREEHGLRPRYRLRKDLTKWEFAPSSKHECIPSGTPRTPGGALPPRPAG